MIEKRISAFLVAFMIISMMQCLYAQKTPASRELKWLAPAALQIVEPEKVFVSGFKNAVYEHAYGFMPMYFEYPEVPQNKTIREARIVNATYITVSEAERQTLDDKKIEDRPKLIIQDYSDNGRLKPRVLVLPYRTISAGGAIEKLVSFEIEYLFDDIPAGGNVVKRTYRGNSVLAGGNWYKVRTPRTGIHRIGYSELLEMGLNPATIDPRNIRIYGNGGKMLPENNSDFRYDDLKENAIYVHGEADGQFNQNDYILFYAQGPSYWTPDFSKGLFNHTINKYSSYAYYFITADLGAGLRIQTDAVVNNPPDRLVNDFNDFGFHENDSVNLIKSGREWFGEVFDIITSYSFSFSFPNINTAHKLRLKTSLAARSKGIPSSFSVNAAGNNLLVTLPGVPLSYNSQFAEISVDTMSFTPAGSNLTISLQYNKPNFAAIGWLNYLSINVRRFLSFTGGQMSFRDLESVAPGSVSEFRLSNTSSGLQVWDVTDFTEPRLIPGSLAGGLYSFKVRTDSLREFVAHSGSGYHSVSFVEKVANQNLHAMDWQEMVIVTHPLFVQQANRLADMHRTHDKMRVAVVQTPLIYNEYGGGATDVSAIRDFMKMFYDRAATNPAQRPKYLLLFGDGSYDPKNRLPNNTNFIPVWQSLESLHPTASYLTDDYFGLLDDNEGQGANGHLDIGIGRLPVSTTLQAQQVVDKIFRYAGLMNSGSDNNCSLYTGQSDPYGDWRNVVCLIADDEDGDLHMWQAEQLGNLINTKAPAFNLDKIYFDAYQQVSTPGGQRYPEVNRAINDRVQKGALIVNYTGHGGETGWAHERVLEISDINSWRNNFNLSVFVTATCEFSRFDDPDPSRVSAGELVFLNPQGGAVAMYTTTRLAFASTNFNINYSMYQYAFTRQNGEYPRMGDIMRVAKVNSGSSSFNRNFVLFGDPALRMAYPKHQVNTVSINGIMVEDINAPDSIALPGDMLRPSPKGTITDTLKALSKVTVTGELRDIKGKKMSDRNGVLYPTVFDKMTINSTLGQDPESSPRNFVLQKSVLYRGKAAITKGNFSFSFIVPRDIAYHFDKGRISYYARIGNEDATGWFGDFLVGGINANAPADNLGPEIKLFLNDEQFAFGGMTDENPVLIAVLSDSSGINTVGNGIGHDLTATLNDNTNQSLVLNDYYQADMDSYTGGSVRYPLSKLTEGPNNLRFKAWDVYNNSAEAYTEFIVSKSAEMSLMHVLNYPNPFTTHTSFMFEHNQVCSDLDVEIRIFTVSGKLIKTIHRPLNISGFLVGPGEITWDGRDDYGSKIGRGVYIYKVKVSDRQGKTAEKTEKLVILN